jgi:hypothetical protein
MARQRLSAIVRWIMAGLHQLSGTRSGVKMAEIRARGSREEDA